MLLKVISSICSLFRSIKWKKKKIYIYI